MVYIHGQQNDEEKNLTLFQLKLHPITDIELFQLSNLIIDMRLTVPGVVQPLDTCSTLISTDK